MSVNVYSGWSAKTILYNHMGNIDTKQIPLALDVNPISWDNNKSPDGWGNNTITSTVPAGYIVKYSTYYALKGYSKTASLGSDYRSKMYVTLWDYTNKNLNRIDTLYGDVFYDDFWRGWNIGPPIFDKPIPIDYLTNPPDSAVPAYLVGGDPVITIPGGISFSNEVFRYSSPDYVIFQILVRVLVTRDCTTAHITAPICREICVANPTDPACYTSYAEHCLTGDPKEVRTPVCQEYLLSYINKNNGSTIPIDRQFQAYCKKYTSLGDFLTKTLDNPVDRSICGCNITSQQPGISDPNATVLYTNYFNSIAAEWPGFRQLGYKEKCVFGACASSPFVYAGAGRACNVADCIQVALINNNGSVSGDINVDQTCNNYKTGGPGSSIWSNLTSGSGLIALIIIVIVVLIVIVYLFSIIGTQGNSSEINDSNSRSYNSSLQAQLPTYSM